MGRSRGITAHLKCWCKALCIEKYHNTIRHSKSTISNNGTQFDYSVYRDLCSKYGIRPYFSTLAYTQSNGQAEASNKSILDGIKKRLEKAKGKWVEELPSVLWAHRTTLRRSTRETPFALSFGTQPIIPLKIGLPTLKSKVFDIG